MLGKFLQSFLRGSERSEEKATESEAPTELSLARAHLNVEQRDQVVALRAEFHDEPMLMVKGRLCGNASMVSGQAGGRPATLVSFPVEVPGQTVRVQVTAAHSGKKAPSENFERLRATRRRVPEGQAIEVAYGRENSQIRFLIEMPLAVEVVEFEEFSQARPVFEEVPPVSQMVAFLKATIHQRRTTLRSLGAMARRTGDPRLEEMASEMEKRLSGGHDFSNSGIGLARKVLEYHGRTVYPNTVAALCLLADIYLDNLGPVELERLVDEQEPLNTSPEAARAVTEFLGVSGTSRTWKELRPDGMKAPRWRVARRAAEFLQRNLGQRNALTVLSDLAEDSGSERSRTRVNRLLERVPADQVLVNDEHEALAAYLAAAGRKIQTETVAAMGIYVDFEAGILSEEDIDSLAPNRGFWDTSLYGMLAIAGAFDQELTALELGGRADKRWSHLARLLGLTQTGVIARFLERGQPGYTTLFLDSAGAVAECRHRDLRFTGEVLVHLPTINYLNEPDLQEITAATRPVMACFGSDDRRVQWRRIATDGERPDAAEDLVKSQYGYIHGYRVFNFYQKVIGRVRQTEGERLRSGTLIYRDQRGNAHFKHWPSIEDMEEVAKPAQHGWQWQGEVLEYPELHGLPTVMTELAHDHLLGRPESHSQERSRLDWVHSGVRQCLEHPFVYHQLAHLPEIHRLLQKALESSAVASVLVGLLDERGAFDEAALWLADPLLEALNYEPAIEFVALAVEHGLSDLEGEAEEKFRELLLDRLYALADSEEPALRACACRMLGSALLAGDDERCLAARYMLSRTLENERRLVAAGAARSLAALGLQSVLELPPLVTTREPARLAAHAGEADEDASYRYALLTHQQVETTVRGLVQRWKAFADMFDMDLATLVRDSDWEQMHASYVDSSGLLDEVATLPDLQALEWSEEAPEADDEHTLVRRSQRFDGEVEHHQLERLHEGRYFSLLHPEGNPGEVGFELEMLNGFCSSRPARASFRVEPDYDQVARELSELFNLSSEYLTSLRTLLVGIWAGGPGDAEELEADDAAAVEAAPLTESELKIQELERAVYEATQRLEASQGEWLDADTGLPGLPFAEALAAQQECAVAALAFSEPPGARELTLMRSGPGWLARATANEFLLLWPGVPVHKLAGLVLGWERELKRLVALGMAPASDQAVNLAREALLAAREGGARYRFAEGYSDEDHDFALWAALDSDQFVVHYQPVVDLRDGRVVGAEALLRWHHPELGLRDGEAFLEQARTAGLMPSLGVMVLRQVNHDRKAWPNLTSSLNLSPLQWQHPEVRHELDQVSRELVIELSEAPGHKPESPVSHNGVRFAYNQVGGGTWSLEGLLSGQPEFFKLDRTLLQKPQLLARVVQLSLQHRVEPVAVGVETPAHLELLRTLNCRLGQGHLFSQAVTAAEFANLSKQRLLPD